MIDFNLTEEEQELYDIVVKAIDKYCDLDVETEALESLDKLLNSIGRDIL